MTNRQILLVSRPTGEPSEENFRLVEAPVPSVKDGEVLVRHRYLSLDPYMRSRMSEERSYAPPQPLGEVMTGGTVGTVVESRAPRFAAGDSVVGMGGWQEYGLYDATRPGTLRRVDTHLAPLSVFLGALGMPGVTAWYGLTRIIAPKAGETVVVSAASGAVGSVVGQLARARGARVVGIAGGPEKCRYVTQELGFDACLDHRAHPGTRAMAAALKVACPNGIDGNFENVGGPILDAVLLRANPFARVALCGTIAGYNGAPIPLMYPQLLVRSRIRLEGFIISDHMEVWPEALRELGAMMAAGQLKYRESVVRGLDAAPAAFLGMLRGANFGKQLVQLD